MAIKRFNAVSGFSVGNDIVIDIVDSNANIIANSLTVSAIANLGAVGNVKITGGTSSQVLSTDGTGNLSWITSSSSSGWIKKVANYTASPSDQIIADTSAGSFTITLPATPTTGMYVAFADGDDWYTNNLTIARNGSTIEGAAENLLLNIKGIRVDLIYDGTTWEVYAYAGPSGVDTSNDTTTNSTVYPTWVTSTSGNQPVKVSSTKLYFNPSTGQLNSTDFNSLSDLRKKKDVETITSAGDIVNQLRGVYFKWKDTERPAIGVIAQEVEKILPEIVATSDTGEKSVSYNSIIAVLIEAIKEQQQEINIIKKRLEN